MEIPEDVIVKIIEQIRQIQISLRGVRSELEKWKQKTVEPSSPALQEQIDPPTEKQILFLKALGVEEIPESKVEARRLLQELNEKREAGEYLIPPTAKQLKYLDGLGYGGPIPESKEAAWKLLQELKRD